MLGNASHRVLRTGHRRRRHLLRAAAVALLLAAAWHPFELDAAPVVVNRLEVMDGGLLRFLPDSYAWTDEPPGWLGAAIEDSTLSVALEVRPDRQYQPELARILALSADPFSANLVIGQHDADLVVRVRRPGSDETGSPPYVVRDVFSGREWREVGVRIQPRQLEIAVDGAVELVAPLPANALQAWDRSHRLSLGNEPTANRGWAGEVRGAAVLVRGTTYDYLSPGRVGAPARYWRVDKLHEFLRPSVPTSPVRDAQRAAAYAGFGFLLAVTCRTRPTLRFVLLAGLVIALATELSQSLFAFRHARASDLVLNALAAMGGGLAVRAWAPSWAFGPPMYEGPHVERPGSTRPPGLNVRSTNRT